MDSLSRMTEAMAKLHSRITRLEAQEIFLVEHDTDTPEEWHTQQIEPPQKGGPSVELVNVQRNADTGAYIVKESKFEDTAARRAEMALEQQRNATVKLMDTEHISEVGGRNNGSKVAYERIYQSIRNHSGSSGFSSSHSSHSLPESGSSSPFVSPGESSFSVDNLQDHDLIPISDYPYSRPKHHDDTARILDGYRSRHPNVSASDAVKRTLDGYHSRHPKVLAPDLYPAHREPPVPNYVVPAPLRPNPVPHDYGYDYGYRGFPPPG